MGGYMSLGGFLSLGASDLLNFTQQYHSHCRQEKWSKRGYDLSLQSMRIDILNTVREEMRDQVTVIVSSLDNLMVVATLMLSIGFGFVVEGTFPPPEESYEYSDFQRCLLVVYALLCALSLVFPLACLMLTIAARFEVELCQQDVMGDLQKHLLRALERDQEVQKGPSSGGRGAPRQEQRPRNSGGCWEEASPRRLFSSTWSGWHSSVDSLGRSSQALGCCPVNFYRSKPGTRRRRRGSCPTIGRATSPLLRQEPQSPRLPSDPSPCPTRLNSREWAAATGDQEEPQRRLTKACAGLRHQLSQQLGTLVVDDHVGHVVEQEVRDIARGLGKKVSYYEVLYSLAQLFLWLGMVSAVLTCSILLGLYFGANYPYTPWMWRCYSGILVSCAVSSVGFLVWMKYWMLAEPISKAKSQPGLLPSAMEPKAPEASPSGWSTVQEAGPEGPPPGPRLGGWSTVAVASEDSLPDPLIFNAEAPRPGRKPFRLQPRVPPPPPDHGSSCPGPLTEEKPPLRSVLKKGGTEPGACQHPLEKSTRETTWTCDSCHQKFWLNGLQRYRCSMGCNYDLCEVCLHARDAPEEGQPSPRPAAAPPPPVVAQCATAPPEAAAAAAAAGVGSEQAEAAARGAPGEKGPGVEPKDADRAEGRRTAAPADKEPVRRGDKALGLLSRARSPEPPECSEPPAATRSRGLSSKTKCPAPGPAVEAGGAEDPGEPCGAAAPRGGGGAGWRAAQRRPPAVNVPAAAAARLRLPPLPSAPAGAATSSPGPDSAAGVESDQELAKEAPVGDSADEEPVDEAAAARDEALWRLTSQADLLLAQVATFAQVVAELRGTAVPQQPKVAG